MGASYATTTLILILSITQIINADTSQHKKVQLGFQGVRGKRSTNTFTSEEAKELLKNVNNIPSNGDVIVTSSPDIMSSQLTDDNDNVGGNSGGGDEGGMSFNGGDQHYFDGLSDIALYKRAPMGFMGMRGKKDSEYTNMHKRALLGLKGKNFLFNYPSRFIPKRAPSGFFGMRGKKFYDDGLLGYDYDIKRAPTGFMGMRGKKDNLDEWIDETNQDAEYLWLETLAAEQDLLRDIERLYQLEHFDSNNALIAHEDKRVPQGFMGMRGKKFYSDDGSSDSLEDNNDLNDNYNGDDKVSKRDPNAGFFGMRGKKSFDDDGIFHEDKRVPMGFHGMRGKRDVNEIYGTDEVEEIKRAPAGFFGMRGKKQPNGQGFFGMRGKKGPFDYRELNRFVGMRGKKVPYGRIRQLQTDLESEMEMPSLLASEMIPDKRVPSGFYGVRGKKWSDLSSTENM